MSHAGQALEKAYAYYRDDCVKYGIKIIAQSRIIEFNGKLVRYDPYTTERIYKMELRRLIKIGKEQLQKKLDANQGRLL